MWASWSCPGISSFLRLFGSTTCIQESSLALLESSPNDLVFFFDNELKCFIYPLKKKKILNTIQPLNAFGHLGVKIGALNHLVSIICLGRSSYSYCNLTVWLWRYWSLENSQFFQLYMCHNENYHDGWVHFWWVKKVMSFITDFAKKAMGNLLTTSLFNTLQKISTQSVKCDFFSKLQLNRWKLK